MTGDGHSGIVIRTEDPARDLNNQITELQARVAFPHHWSGGEHELHVEKLRQLRFQKSQLSKQLENPSPKTQTLNQISSSPTVET